jgi:outer membrane protein assembly factor BamB
MHPIVFILGTITLINFLIAVLLSTGKSVRKGLCVFSWFAAALQLLMFATAFYFMDPSVPAGSIQNDLFGTEPKATQNQLQQSEALETTEAPPVTTLAPVDPRLSFAPYKTENSDPELFQLTWEIAVGDEIVESFTREEPICFELDKEYFALPGIATFRGNNYRNNASYGTAVIEKETMGIAWSHRIGNLNKWGGCAWTGQPLLVQWDAETKAIMETMYDSKKNKEDLVEVIYATLDGYIHFYDLEDGSKTRDAIKIGMNFKGAGALDPRGYPLLYVGAGLYINGKAPRMFVINLITGKIIYEHGHDDPYAIRDWSAFDSSPLVDEETDTLIWPGESGVLYTIKLNTEYDKEAGTISVSPDAPVKTRYTSYYSVEEKRYLGYEASASIVDHYLFTSENGGLFHCVDLNTMELVWAQDTKDDSNSSPVFEWGENGEGYIYTAPSLHWTAKGHDGSISIYKMDASNGEILWQYDRECVRYDDIAGGVQCTPLLGKEGTNIDGLIIYSIGRTPSAYRGVLTALDKDTGEMIWEISSGNYAWSSPVALYTEDGHAYIFLANASGIARLIDGATGEILATIDLDETVEASPVAFGNMLVIGSREGVYGIKIS